MSTKELVIDRVAGNEKFVFKYSKAFWETLEGAT